MTLVALRHTFSRVAPMYRRMMLSENAIRCYGLDAGALRPVAKRIGAPSVHELAVPPERLPERTASLAFRTLGPWG
jgi:hypothetical protein